MCSNCEKKENFNLQLLDTWEVCCEKINGFGYDSGKTVKINSAFLTANFIWEYISTIL